MRVWALAGLGAVALHAGCAALALGYLQPEDPEEALAGDPEAVPDSCVLQRPDDQLATGSLLSWHGAHPPSSEPGCAAGTGGTRCIKHNLCLASELLAPSIPGAVMHAGLRTDSIARGGPGLLTDELQAFDR